MSSLEIFADQPFTTVTSGGTDAPLAGTGESWSVADGSAFPAAASGETQFHIVDTASGFSSEIITVTASARTVGATFTVIRGAEGTTPIAHNPGFQITQVITSGWLNNVSGTSPPGGGTAGSILYDDPSSVAAWLAGNTTATKQFLTSTGAGGTANTPAWGTIATADVPTLNQDTTGTAANVSGTVAVPHGGLGASSLTAYAVVIGGTATTSPAQQVSGVGTSGQVLTSNGAAALPTWQANVALVNPMTVHGDMIYESAGLAAAAVAGNTTSTKNFLTSTGSGGTANTPAWGTIATADVPTLNQDTTGTALNVTGTVATINGGTGRASLTAYAVVTGGTASTTATQQVSGAGTSGQVLTSAGASALPAWTALPAAGASTGGTIILAGDLGGGPSSPQVVSTHLTAGLPVTQGGIGGTTATAYAVVAGGTSATTAFQQVSGVGTSSQVLTSNGAGSLPTWQAVSGRFLATSRYAPATQTGFGINSTTPAAFASGTVATQSFTAPASGGVLVTVNCMLVTSAAGVYVAMYLSPSGSTTTISSDVIQYESPAGGFSPQQAFPFYLTGLTPGTSYDFDLVGSVTSGQSGTIVAFTQTSYPPTIGTLAVRGGPVVITVQAV